MRKKYIFLIAAAGLLIIISGIVFILGKKNPAPAPFSSLTWESTYDDMTQREGSPTSSYDSVYGGVCYTYPKEYEGYSGTVKYMFDDKDALKCIAWTYGSDDSDELHGLYEKINSAVNKACGESDYQPQSPTNYGNVWYRETGNIILSIMDTSSNKALQYSYLHPDVSHEQK